MDGKWLMADRYFHPRVYQALSPPVIGTVKIIKANCM
jgi:hypothetical protein